MRLRNRLSVSIAALLALGTLACGPMLPSLKGTCWEGSDGTKNLLFTSSSVGVSVEGDDRTPFRYDMLNYVTEAEESRHRIKFAHPPDYKLGEEINFTHIRYYDQMFDDNSPPPNELQIGPDHYLQVDCSTLE